MDVAQASGPTLLFGHAAKDTDVSTIEPHHNSYIGNAPDLSSSITVPLTQRAIVPPEVGKELNMSLRTILVREPDPGEVDSIFSVGPQPGYPKHNHIAGHEGIGYIVKSRDPTLVPSTDRLYGIHYLAWACESCTYCLRGLTTSCPFQLNTPKQIPGTFQEYVTVPSTVLVPLPETISQGGIDTALYTGALCSGSTALMSLRAALLSPGDVVVVAGALGALSHLTGMIAKKVMRPKVIGVDISSKTDRVSSQEVDDCCDLLLQAPECYEGSAWEKFHAALLRACAQLRSGHVGGVERAAEAVIVTSSSIVAFQRLDKYVCDDGIIVCAGVPKRLNIVSLPLHSLIERKLRLTGNLMGGHEETLEVMEYIRAGRITPRITNVGLEEVPNQLQAMVDCQTIGKVVLSL
ncbi:chaperonin 10-like protein [Aspergillus insuetus]